MKSYMVTMFDKFYQKVSMKNYMVVIVNKVVLNTSSLDKAIKFAGEMADSSKVSVLVIEGKPQKELMIVNPK